MNQVPSPNTLTPAGCDIKPVDNAGNYVTWLLGETNAEAPSGTRGLVWALAHCDDGVTWGFRDAADTSAWRFGSQFFPGLCPAVRLKRLQELRIFGEKAEILIWRTDAGLRGRLLKDADTAASRDADFCPMRPADESRIIRGDYTVEDHPSLAERGGFTRIADRTGQEQVVPVVVSSEQLRHRSLRLQVRHYFERNAETGSVRIVATRLVKLVL